MATGRTNDGVGFATARWLDATFAAHRHPLHHLHHFPPLVLRAWSSGPLRDGDWPASAPVPTCMRCLHRCMVALSSRSAPLLRAGMQQCCRDRTRAVTRMRFWSSDFWSHSCLVGRCDGQERMGRPRCRCHQDSRGCGSRWVGFASRERVPDARCVVSVSPCSRVVALRTLNVGKRGPVVCRTEA